MKQITAALLGAGQRGADVYGAFAANHNDMLKFVSVAESDDDKRRLFGDKHSIPSDDRYHTWEELLSSPKKADAIFICMQDRMHFAPVVEAIRQGYHILLEKPMSVSADECLSMGELAKEYDKTFVIAHVLRYTPFFQNIKALLTEGRIGKLITVQHNENIGYWHFAHSFVRGNWRNSLKSSPMILQKTCHDLDILLWLIDSDCLNVSSFGSLSHFKADNAPEGAPDRCTDGCPAMSFCPYYAPKQYLTDNTDWPTSVISTDMSAESRLKALQTGPYGRCVYRCDNDVCDNQIVNLNFANGVTAAFSVSAFTRQNTRLIHLMGSTGEIYASMDDGVITVNDFKNDTVTTLTTPTPDSGHGGGDDRLTESFIKLITNGGEAKTPATVSVQSHLIAFAAEESRLRRTVVTMDEFIDNIKRSASTVK